MIFLRYNGNEPNRLKGGIKMSPIINVATTSASRSLRRNFLHFSRTIQRQAALRPGMTRSSGYRRKKGGYTKIYEATQKQQFEESTQNIVQNWGHQSEIKDVMDKYYLLVYAFLNDDGKLTFKEQRKLRKMLKKDQERLNQKDIHQVMSFVDQKPNEKQCIEYLSTHQVPVELLKKEALFLKQSLKFKVQYTHLINRVVKQYESDNM